METSKTFYTGCLHWGHENMVRGVTKWKDGYRDFNTVDEHDLAIIAAINKYVGVKDKLVIVGDVKMGNKNMLRNRMKFLACQDITLVYGNHDDFIRDNITLIDQDGEYKPQDLFTRCCGKIETVERRRVISVDHYPYEFWRDMDKVHLDGYMFHSHVHGQMHHIRKRKRIDVGMDSAMKYFGEYKPFEESEAIELSLLTT